ncbi:hypothetical protein [Aquimarina litoralis]|uniref:hypothetical protein n=1 Tax=Aquimarina litoralis TaxID=584605 RepID=UPI001C57137F|nr:hypothetical protein [Aquimarina litoralis]MBW1296867.1 hypothetical protein [Aquimarina litoralis]
MFKNLLNLNGAQAISKKEQQTINGGGLSRGNCYPFFHLGSCRFNCDCRTRRAEQPSGASQYCLLNYPYYINNAVQCGGAGGPGDWA